MQADIETLAFWSCEAQYWPTPQCQGETGRLTTCCAVTVPQHPQKAVCELTQQSTCPCNLYALFTAKQQAQKA